MVRASLRWVKSSHVIARGMTLVRNDQPIRSNDETAAVSKSIYSPMQQLKCAVKIALRRCTLVWHSITLPHRECGAKRLHRLFEPRRAGVSLPPTNFETTSLNSGSTG
jgi:hypothetical protein